VKILTKVEPLLFGAEPAWYKDKALDILCIVMQVKKDVSLPSENYDIDSIEKLAYALRKVYEQGQTKNTLSDPDEIVANKKKLLAGYFEVQAKSIKYLWDEDAPLIDFSFSDSLTIKNPHDIDTLVEYEAHGRTNKVEEALSAELYKKGDVDFLPRTEVDWTKYSLERDFDRIADDGTPKKKKAKSGSGPSQTAASPDSDSGKSILASSSKNTTLGKDALERLQSKMNGQNGTK
jgi:hypothetical protein